MAGNKGRGIAAILLVSLLLIPLIVAPGCATWQLKLTDLSIAPEEATAGETVAVTARISNIGFSEVEYSAVLAVDGVGIETQNVTVAPGITRVLHFSLLAEKPGSYKVTVGRLSSTLTVVARPAEFELISFYITPVEVTTDRTVTVVAGVNNTGGSEGIYSAVLSVDGVEVETQNVTVAPGIFKTVTFTLTEDKTGTYRIAVGRMSSLLTVIEPIEVKYDDGTKDAVWAISGMERGPAVRFSPSVSPFTIDAVKLYGQLYDTEHMERLAQLQIRDKDFNILHIQTVPYASFKLQPAWLRIAIQDIVVAGEFYVVFYANSLAGVGIGIGGDLSGTNEHSETVSNEKIVVWFAQGLAKDKTNWMIRVMGYPTPAPGDST